LLARGSLFESGTHVGRQEQDENAQNKAETQIKPLANRHEKKPPLASCRMCTANRTRELSVTQMLLPL